MAADPTEQNEAEASAERSTTPVELLWDLVFVFAVTQVITLLSQELTWAGLGRAGLVLALIWWAWSAFVWATNAEDPRLGHLPRCPAGGDRGDLHHRPRRAPRFGRDGTLFAATYALVRLMHLGLYVDASRRGNASLAAISGFAVTVANGLALLLGGSLVHGSARPLVWAVAAAIDYAGPAWLTRKRLRGLQRVAVAHFAEALRPLHHHLSRRVDRRDRPRGGAPWPPTRSLPSCLRC